MEYDLVLESLQTKSQTKRICTTKCSKDSFLLFVLFLVMIGICVLILYLSVKEKIRN
jgi:Trk-type K+ transport system membrane component